MSIRIEDSESTTLRFKVGDAIECNCGTWKRGTVVRLFYTQKNFPEGMCAPYQVQLDDGKLIFAPLDEDKVCRAPLDGESSGGYDDEFPDEEIADSDKLPVTVVTGFLGAGKTTLINHILTSNHGKRVCVIENEFGAVNIDEGLVKENLQVAEEIISLDNGCACCTVRGDLLRALTQLKDRRKDFDLLLLETTGLANPAPVVATFTQNATVANNFRVDGIVCLVDSKFIVEHINEARQDDTINESVTQIAFADRVLLNKTDLVSKEELKELKETISSINSFAELYETERSKVPLEKVMDLSAFSIERMTAALEEFDIEEDEEDEAHGHGHSEDVCMDDDHAHGHGHAEAHDHGHAEQSHEHGHVEAHGHGHAEKAQRAAKVDENCGKCVAEVAHDHAHAEGGKPKKKKHDLSGVGSLGLTATKPLVSAQFNKFMSDLLQTKARDLYRSKGILCFEEEGDAKFIFQGVHEQIQYTTAKTPWAEGEPRISKCVFIGRELDHDVLRAGWASCQVGYEAPKE